MLFSCIVSISTLIYINHIINAQAVNPITWVILNAYSYVSFSSIYHLREDTLICSETQKKSKRLNSASSDVSQTSSKLALRKEREYIDDVQRRYHTSVRSVRKHVLVHAMKEYHRPTTQSTPGSYGSPRNHLRSGHTHKVGVQTVPIRRVSSGALGQTRYRSGSPCKQTRPGAKSEFCDVLGPVSCQRCIENVNRQLASDLQSRTFPVECSTTRLVGPTLLKLMSDQRYSVAGHNNDSARRAGRSKTSQSLPARIYSRDISSPVKLPVLRLGQNTKHKSGRPSSMEDGFLAGQAISGRTKNAHTSTVYSLSAKTN